MSVRAVVRIQEFQGGGGIAFFLESPPGIPDAKKLQRLQSVPGQPPFSDMQQGDGSPARVIEAGRKLYDDLTSHSAVKFAIAAALQEALDGCSPIYLRMDDTITAEELPWESVCRESSDFLALDDRWPIVRVREAQEPDPRRQYDFEPPLRITAVLSAAGSDSQTRIPAKAQWEAMYGPISSELSKHDAIPVTLTVLVGEGELLEHIRGLQQPWITCDLITDKEGLLDRIRSSQPHLLHFFCHGTSEENPHLQIGSFTDWEAGREGTVAVTAVELRQRADPNKGIWLVTLNCCESATLARDGRAIASGLVAAGFPAALGMREKIDAQLAHAVCKEFYPSLLGLIAKAIPDGPNLKIEWAQALGRVRTKLAGGRNGKSAQEAARGCKTWTIPTLYTRYEPFELKRIKPQAVSPGLSEAKKRQIDYIQQLQQERTKAAEDYKDLPPEALRDILADFDAQLAKAIERLKTTN